VLGKVQVINLLRKMKIRQKLIILLLIIGLVPTLLVSIIAYATISRQLSQKTDEQLASLATKQGQRLNALLQDRQEEVLKLANRYDLQSAISAYKAGGSKDPSAITAVLRARKTETTDVQSIYLTDPKDNVIATSVSGERKDRLAASDYSVKAGQLNSVTIRTNSDDGIQRLYIATLMTVNQQQVGNLTLVFGLEDIVATLHDYTGLGNTGDTVLGASNNSHRIVSLFAPRFNDQAVNVSLSSLHLSDNMGKTYDGVTDYRGHEVIVSAQPVASANWLLATKIDAAEAFAPTIQLRNTLLFIVTGLSVIIVLIALLFTSFFVRPIMVLIQKTHSIMMGNFTERIAVTSADEVGTLAAAFNVMTDRLAKSYQALEHKVQERTQALNQKLQELSNAKAKDEAILSSVGEGMIVTDSAGGVVLMNALAGDLLGIDPAKNDGKLLAATLLYPDKQTPIPQEERAVEVAVRTRQKVKQEVQSVNAEGRKRVLNITATPVLQQGELVGAIQIVRDITREREIDRMKTEFISLASHQLRTPLSAISWYSEMLIEGDVGKLNDEQMEFANNVYQSCQRMTELVSSLLNISRIESGRIRIDPKPTDVYKLVDGIVHDLKGKTEERKQTIVMSVNDSLPLVNLDARLISQVYLNILTNAIKYSPKGGEIQVFVSRKDDNLVSQITDSGYGIPKAEQPKLFQKFFRATNVSKVETDGTGLGMYLVKSIIESSGGKIWFDSDEGKGTTFWFSLPMSGMKAKEGEVTLD
jgi:PAS domain S-box-containing protein